jgi:hypothetical protein
MNSTQMQLARRRLWLGITNVGCWVLAAGAGLCWLVIFDAGAPSRGPLIAIGVGVIAAQAVFDFIGGVTLMPGPRPSATTFLRRWSRGILGHTLVLAAVGIVSAISLRLTGGFGAGIVFATFALALGRRQLLWAIGGVATEERSHDGERIFTSVVSDPAFTGGIVGLGRRAKSLLPADWIYTLPNPELAAESSRRRWHIANALPARAFVLILLWNLLGTFIGTQVLHLAARPLAAALFGHACWMTLWTFGGLLVLPALSRKAVFAADRAAAESGHDPRAWITRFRDLVGEDGSPNATVQTIFYPVPSAEMRLRQLGQPTTGFVPGNLARTNLYYSWATLTLLGRAVHCNVGRPALWVYPPSA